MSVLTCLAAALLAGGASAEGPIHIRAVSPKQIYRPGESILLEMTCSPGLTDAVSITTSTFHEGLSLQDDQRCPHARFPLTIPRDFVGRGGVGIMMRHRKDVLRDDGLFTFTVRPAARPKGFLVDTSVEGAGIDRCVVRKLAGEPTEQSIALFAVLSDGERASLCRGAEVSARTDQPKAFEVHFTGSSCSFTSRKDGRFKLSVSYAGARKEYACHTERLDEPGEAGWPVPDGP